MGYGGLHIDDMPPTDTESEPIPKAVEAPLTLFYREALRDGPSSALMPPPKSKKSKGVKRNKKSKKEDESSAPWG